MFGILAGGGSAGVSVFGGAGAVVDSVGGVSGGRVTCVGGIVLMVAILTGRGGRVRGWVAGGICAFGRPTA